MVASYATAPGDVDIGLGERTVVLVEKKSSTGRTWKACGALAIVALCVGTTLFVAWHWSGRPGAAVRSSSVSDFDQTLWRISV